MKKLNIALTFVALLTFVSLSFGQTATTSTTLAAAVSDSSGRTITLTSATNVNAPTIAHSGSQLYVDREQMTVTAVNGTTIGVVRGTSGTVAMPHLSGATVYVDYPVLQGNFGAFLARSKVGACTAGNENYLPQIAINPPFGVSGGLIQDCFASSWYFDLNLPFYKLTLAPGAQRSSATPTTGATSSLVAQAGGASTAAGTAGANGGPITVGSGAGGAGASTGTGGNGGTATLSSGAGGAAAGAAATGGNGGTVAITAGASGGSITSGNGGSVNVTAGASANGSSAAGNGGSITLRPGAVGTGGTGVAGVTRFADATDATKLISFAVSGITTGTTRIVTWPDAAITVASVSERACGTTTTCAATVTNNVITTYGSAALSSATPSTASITGLPFSSNTSYFCTATPEGTTAAIAAGGIAINKTSGSGMTLTGPNTVTTVIDYVCHGT